MYRNLENDDLAAATGFHQFSQALSDDFVSGRNLEHGRRRLTRRQALAVRGLLAETAGGFGENRNRVLGAGPDFGHHWRGRRHVWRRRQHRLRQRSGRRLRSAGQMRQFRKVRRFQLRRPGTLGACAASGVASTAPLWARPAWARPASAAVGSGASGRAEAELCTPSRASHGRPSSSSPGP